MRYLTGWLWRYVFFRRCVIELAMVGPDVLAEWLDRNTPVMLGLHGFFLRRGDYAMAGEIANILRARGDL